MNKKIKIGDIVVYSPSLSPIIGRVKGIAGEHLMIRTEDNTRLECTTNECCPITEEEYNRFRKLKGELEMATNLSSEETRKLVEQNKEESEE